MNNTTIKSTLYFQLLFSFDRNINLLFGLLLICSHCFCYNNRPYLLNCFSVYIKVMKISDFTRL